MMGMTMMMIIIIPQKTFLLPFTLEYLAGLFSG